MEERSYYAHILYPYDNRDSMSSPFEINCTGYVKLEHPFVSCTERKDYYLQVFDVGTLEDGSGKTIIPGQFMIRPPKTLYQYHFDGGVLGYYWAHFTGFHVGRFLKENGIEVGKIYTLEHGITDAIREEFEGIFNEFMLRQRGWRDAAAARLMGLLVTMIRDTVEVQPSAARFEESLMYIHGHYTEEISTGYLAEMEHLSESRYREVFRTVFGCSPKEYIIGLRMSGSCELLKTTDMTITQVAQTSGYEDAMYFSRIFRFKNGCSPAAYRKRNRTETGVELERTERETE